MIKMKDIGNFETVPKIVEDILNEDISALEEHLKNGFDVNKIIRVGKYTTFAPINIALIMGKFKSVKWLVEHNANLNDKKMPAFLTAVRYCNEKVVRYVVEHGADIHAINNLGTEAFYQALVGKKTENFAVIEELGLTVKKYGGEAFRSAVSDRNYKAMDFFISHGVDINFNKPDSVYPFKPTPLCVAARYVDLEMCKYLVEHGADLTIAEKDGMRPYSIAVEKGDAEMVEYFKNLEPKEFHSKQNKLNELKPFKLPKTLLEYLEDGNLKMQLEGEIEFIDFFNLYDTVPMKVGRQKLLRISRETDNYGHIYFVWNPKSKKISAYDMEHEELTDLGTFEEFMKNAASLIEEKLF